MTDALDAALMYVARGWPVIKLAPRTKIPRGEKWHDRALRDDEAVRDAFNSHPANVGVLLLPNGANDVDLDCAEALAVGGFFLPPTGMIFGRKSSRYAHHIYKSNAAAIVGKAALTFDDPDPPKRPDGSMGKARLLELRVGGGGKAAQTVFPGSTHEETGEPIEFEPGCDKDPAEVDGAELIRACEEAAAAALIARAYPRDGGHHPAQVLGGFLARAGWPVPRVKLFAEAVLHHVGGPHAGEHVRTAQNAAEARERGSNAYGFPLLAETFGEKRAKAIAKWLHYSEASKAGTRRTRTRQTKNGHAEPESDVETIERLAKLAPLEYERQRMAAADQLGCRASVLDAAVRLARGTEGTEAPGQGRPLDLPDPAPWDDLVDGPELLEATTSAIRCHVVMSDHEADAAALWVVHCYAFDLFPVTPRLGATSPEKRCGKTTLLDVLACLVPRPLLAANISAAATFRTIEMVKPTLLIDEADTFLGDNEELRGVLNSGHRAGGSVVRLVGEKHEPRRFATHAPVAIALIGTLPGTLADRSIRLRLRRRRPDEHIRPFRADCTDGLAQLARMAARWVRDNRERLAQINPNCGRLFNRDADNWRPLLAIADAAGSDWPARARNAAERMVADAADDQESVGTMLLADIQAMFRDRAVDRLASEEIVDQLHKLEGRPWPEYGRSRKPITKNALARLLKQFRIMPDTIRVGSATPKGYMLAAFREAFGRYLSPEGDSQLPQRHKSWEPRDSAESQPQQAEAHVAV